MARRSPGLQKRGGVWQIDKHIRGHGRLCESTGCEGLAEAEAYLARRVAEITAGTIAGQRPTVTFGQAARKFLRESVHLRSVERYAFALERLMPHLGDLSLEQVHNDALRPYKEARLRQGVKAGTVNKELATVRRILNLAARVWRHQNGMSYLDTAPLIELLPAKDSRAPYPLTYAEQTRLLNELPPHLQKIVLFAVNTGLREQELCGLTWLYEHQVEGIERPVFVLPPEVTKNSRPRVILLNRIAAEIVDSVRGDHNTWMFTYNGKPLTRINNTAFRKARDRAGVPARVHDLRHTFATRLRQAGVSHEDRQDLLGHANGNVTTHYSAAELGRLRACVELLCEERGAVLVRAIGNESRKSHEIIHGNSSTRQGRSKLLKELG